MNHTPLTVRPAIDSLAIVERWIRDEAKHLRKANLMGSTEAERLAEIGNQVDKLRLELRLYEALFLPEASPAEGL